MISMRILEPPALAAGEERTQTTGDANPTLGSLADFMPILHYGITGTPIPYDKFRFSIPMDIITGTFREEKVGASWKTDDGIVQGFLIPRNKKALMYVDTNKNGRLDPNKDKMIGTGRPSETAGNANLAYGTWSLDPSTRKGSLIDPDGIEIGIFKVSDTSFF